MTDCHSPGTLQESSRRSYEIATSRRVLKTTTALGATKSVRLGAGG
jgi:hypothetical protein